MSKEVERLRRAASMSNLDLERLISGPGLVGEALGEDDAHPPTSPSHLDRLNLCELSSCLSLVHALYSASCN